MPLGELPQYLEEWLREKNLPKADVARQSNLNQAYVYQIFPGRKYPSRDKVIALAFGMPAMQKAFLSELQCNTMNKLCPLGPAGVGWAVN